MVNGTRVTWEEETNAKFQKEMERIGELKRQLAESNSELERRQEYANALQRVLEFSKEQRIIQREGQTIFEPEKLLTQSVKDSLIDIASKYDGLLVVNDAVTILLEAKVFVDREHARNSIYSNLNHYKKRFQKERPGVYRFKETNKVLTLPLTS